LYLCYDPEITDAGLPHLQRLAGLHFLLIGHTRITEEGIERLREALPMCNIDYTRPVSGPFACVDPFAPKTEATLTPAGQKKPTLPTRGELPTAAAPSANP
jgi:hypothetical protein